RYQGGQPCNEIQWASVLLLGKDDGMFGVKFSGRAPVAILDQPAIKDMKWALLLSVHLNLGHSLSPTPDKVMTAACSGEEAMRVENFLYWILGKTGRRRGNIMVQNGEFERVDS
ncbi:TPA: hypothetical protein ACNUTR_004198, partial [Vibrio cholerae]